MAMALALALALTMAMAMAMAMALINNYMTIACIYYGILKSMRYNVNIKGKL